VKVRVLNGASHGQDDGSKPPSLQNKQNGCGCWEVFGLQIRYQQHAGRPKKSLEHHKLQIGTREAIMKRYVAAGILLWSFLCFTEAAANSMSDGADIRGRITKIQPADQGGERRIIGTVFVEANEKDARVDKANLIITDETRIRRKQDDSEIEATFEQLKVGDEIEARFVEGPILMIYPMQVAVSELLVLKAVAGQDPDKKKQTERQYINPNDLSASGSYTHVVVANQRKLIFVSGQVALNKQGEVVGKGDLRAQATQVFENLKIALAAAGATFGDVVKMNTYVVNYRPTDAAMIREVRGKYFAKEKPPASTLVGVQALAREDFLIEVEIIAAMDR
jgi:enamine deaminase RidA (YjgF/YER057c/UK114 family)